jgi:hypothetical protein
MKLRHVFIVIAAFFVFISATQAEERTLMISNEITAEGDISDVLKAHTALIGEMYTILAKKIAEPNPPQVTIYIVPFQEEERLQFPVLVTLQLKEGWSKERRYSSKHFLGYTYTFAYANEVSGRAVVQMSPDLFSRYYTRDWFGNFTIPNSAVFYAIGHELMHVILMAQGVPEETQHCVMVENGMVDTLLDFLEARDKLTYSRFQIRNGEVNSCSAWRASKSM